MKEVFDEDFILQLYKIALKDKKTLELLQQFLKFQYLPNEHYKKIWQAILTEFSLSETKSLPVIPVLKLHFRKDIEVLNILTALKDTEVNNADDILRSLEDFLRQNMFVEMYNEISELYNTGKKDSAYTSFTKNAKDFSDFSLKNKTFDRVFRDFHKRKFEREIEKIEGGKIVRISTGIDELDFLFRGGFETGEFVLIVGESGVGKSFLANHFGVSAARRGYNVAHFQAEGTKAQVMNRYDSAWTGTRYYDIKENKPHDDIRERKVQKIIDGIGGEIFVDCFERFESKSILDVRNGIRELKKEHDIKYVILDYMDLVDPGDGKKYGPETERFRQQKVARACKDIAVEENVVFVSFTQASSIAPEQSNNPEFVITRFHLAEDKGKLRPTDYLISINQTKDEKKQQIVRLHIDKSREHPGSSTAYMYQNLGRSRFYDKKRTINEFFRPENMMD